MQLPSVEAAVVLQDKIVGYLLSPTHRDGRHKAAFFRHFGFSARKWQMLAAALMRHAREHEVVKVEETPFGVRYAVDGIRQTPSGREPTIRTVWFVETGDDRPRLLTAYPLRRTS